MIRFIAAIDNKRGIANEHGIPWQGRIPGDVKYYHDKLKTGIILMGYGVYRELTKPYEGGVNYVASNDPNTELSEGFELVTDARKFIQEAKGDVWNAGGAILFESTFDLADELYLTQLEGDFDCTKFFPAYEQEFTKVLEDEPITENGITYRFTVWQRKSA
jgi:dihydrofolate reductase